MKSFSFYLCIHLLFKSIIYLLKLKRVFDIFDTEITVIITKENGFTLFKTTNIKHQTEFYKLYRIRK